ncbi:hypothetical protein ABTE52_22530, partial [Acinetobacter baumannii]
FEGCIYYTPAMSDEVLGRLHLRKPISIVDGRVRRSRYLGEDVTDYGKMSRRWLGARLVSSLINNQR